MEKNKPQWTSNFGFIMACAGAAVGLGNLWGFPYRLGENGGLAFLLFYIAFVVLAGFPLLLAELAIGRYGGSSPPLAYARFGRRFYAAGLASLTACMIILSYYSFFGGLILKNIFESFGVHFGSGAFWTLIFIIIVASIVLLGIQDGIEKTSELMIPLLILMLVGIVVYTLSSSSARNSLRELFTPHASDFNLKCASSALTQVLFSISLGQGCMIAYGSYAGSKKSFFSSAALIPVIDTLVAMLAATAVLPAAMSKGIDPKSGPSLLFQTVPAIFSDSAFGSLLTLMFYILVLFAAITSALSMLETPAAAMCSRSNLKRGTSILILSSLAFIFSLPVSKSFGHSFSWLKVYEFVSEYILIIIVSLTTCHVVSRIWKDHARLCIFGSLDNHIGKIWMIILKYITPILLISVLISLIINIK